MTSFTISSAQMYVNALRPYVDGMVPRDTAASAIDPVKSSVTPSRYVRLGVLIGWTENNTSSG